MSSFSLSFPFLLIDGSLRSEVLDVADLSASFDLRFLFHCLSPLFSECVVAFMLALRCC